MDLHRLQFSTEHTYVFSVSRVFVSPLVMASSGGRSPSCEFPNCSRASITEILS
jgi:hypothetical protein